MSFRFEFALCAALLPALAVGCAEPSEAEADGPRPIPGADGKADNYITVGKIEFDIYAEATIQLGEDWQDVDEDDREWITRDRAQDRASELWSALEDHIDDEVDAADDWTNLWGLFGPEYSLLWRETSKNVEVLEISDTAMTFRAEIGFLGSEQFYELLTDSTGAFEVEVPEGERDEAETVEFELVPSDTRDAFPQYRELFSDGVFDIGVHFGDDYNEERFDLETARWFVEDYLIDEGWVSESGVQSFDELEADSGPFVRELILEGVPVEARVYITHAEMERADVEAEVRESYRSRDVVIFSGHSGATVQGLHLDYKPYRYVARLQDFEMRDAYQVFVFDGCQSYHSLVEDALEAGKTFADVDIVSTFNTTPFSAGYEVLEGMTELLTLSGDEGDHHPVSWLRILERFNDDHGEGVYYGVHGIEENSQLNPNGSNGVMCTPCTRDEDCPGGGNLCLRLSDGGFCGVACTTDEACGPQASCTALPNDDIHVANQCIPNSRRCG